MLVYKLFLRLKRSFFIMQLPLLREHFRIGNNPEFDIKKDVFSIPETCRMHDLVRCVFKKINF